MDLVATQANTLIVRNAEKAIFARLSEHLQPLGFSMTRARSWTRVREPWIDIIYLHRGGMTYGVPNLQVSYRVQLWACILNGSTDATLTAPGSDGPWGQGYHLRCHARNEATYARCTADLARYCVAVAEPWFRRFGEPAALLQGAGGPLSSQEREEFRKALERKADPEAVAQARKRLGLK